MTRKRHTRCNGWLVGWENRGFSWLGGLEIRWHSKVISYDHFFQTSAFPGLSSSLAISMFPAIFINVIALIVEAVCFVAFPV